jgi:hypothetical protein
MLAAGPPGLTFVSEPIVTRQMAFSVPFQVEQAQNPAQEPVEVQLHLSTDQARTWQLYSKVRPDQKSFLFRCAGDGEYWFTVRTLDKAGALHPSVDRAPILRVVVDTLPPNLQLRATRGSDGQIIAQWEIQDANLKPESLIVQYRVSPTQPWQAVAVDRQNMRYAGPVLTGEVTWWPNATTGSIQVRAEVIDAAGNPAVSHAQVALDAAAAPPARTTLASANADTQNNAFHQANPAPLIAGQAGPPAAAASAPSTPVAGAAPYTVRSLRFELDYDAAAAAPLGPARAEVWCTPDGGSHWNLWTVSETNRSPVRVQVPAPGTYGFRLAFRNAAGQGDPPPQGGDRPECLIQVDPNPPSGRIRDVRSLLP